MLIIWVVLIFWIKELLFFFNCWYNIRYCRFLFTSSSLVLKLVQADLVLCNFDARCLTMFMSFLVALLMSFLVAMFVLVSMLVLVAMLVFVAVSVMMVIMVVVVTCKTLSTLNFNLNYIDDFLNGSKATRKLQMIQFVL